MKNKKREVLGAFIVIIALILTFIFYDYKLAIIIFLALLGNNIERSAKKL